MAAMAKPKTPSRLTIPTVKMTIEITTSSKENPCSVCLRTGEVLRRIVAVRFIVVAIYKCSPTQLGKAAIRECGRLRPTAKSPANS